MDKKGSSQRSKQTQGNRAGQDDEYVHSGAFSNLMGDTGHNERVSGDDQGKSAGNTSKKIQKDKNRQGQAPQKKASKPQESKVQTPTSRGARDTDNQNKSGVAAGGTEIPSTDKKQQKAKTQAKVKSLIGQGGEDRGNQSSRRDVGKYKSMFDKLKQLEEKDAHLRENKGVSPVASIKRSKTVEPRESPKNVQPKSPITQKKQTNEKVKEKVKEKAHSKLQRSKTQDTKTGSKGVKDTQAKKQTGKHTGKKPTVPEHKVQRSRSASAESARSDVSEGRRQEGSTIHGAAPQKKQAPELTRSASTVSGRKREMDPRDAIPTFEKFHRRPPRHVEGDLPVVSVEPKKRVAKIKTTTKTSESQDNQDIIEEKRSPQKPVATQSGTKSGSQAKRQSGKKVDTTTTSYPTTSIVNDFSMSNLLTDPEAHVPARPIQAPQERAVVAPPTPTQEPTNTNTTRDQPSDLAVHVSPKKERTPSRQSTQKKSVQVEDELNLDVTTGYQPENVTVGQDNTGYTAMDEEPLVQSRRSSARQTPARDTTTIAPVAPIITSTPESQHIVNELQQSPQRAAYSIDQQVSQHANQTPNIADSGKSSAIKQEIPLPDIPVTTDPTDIPSDNIVVDEVAQEPNPSVENPQPAPESLQQDIPHAETHATGNHGNASESSMQSRRSSSETSSYKNSAQRNGQDHTDHVDDIQDKSQSGDQSKEGSGAKDISGSNKLILESLNKGSNQPLFPDRATTYDDINFDDNQRRSRLETPDKLMQDSTLDPQKPGYASNTKQNDGTDFSFY